MEAGADYNVKSKSQDERWRGSTLPDFPQDTTDRNRTVARLLSPGNKFEFRMLGSSG